MKTVGKTDIYLPLLRVTGIFNMTGNVNLQDFTSFHTNFLDFRFRKSSDFIDFKEDFSRSVRDLATVGDPSVIIIQTMVILCIHSWAVISLYRQG